MILKIGELRVGSYWLQMSGDKANVINNYIKDEF